MQWSLAYKKLRHSGCHLRSTLRAESGPSCRRRRLDASRIAAPGYRRPQPAAARSKSNTHRRRLPGGSSPRILQSKVHGGCGHGQTAHDGNVGVGPEIIGDKIGRKKRCDGTEKRDTPGSFDTAQKVSGVLLKPECEHDQDYAQVRKPAYERRTLARQYTDIDHQGAEGQEVKNRSQAGLLCQHAGQEDTAPDNCQLLQWVQGEFSPALYIGSDNNSRSCLGPLLICRFDIRRFHCAIFVNRAISIYPDNRSFTSLLCWKRVETGARIDGCALDTRG